MFNERGFIESGGSGNGYPLLTENRLLGAIAGHGTEEHLSLLRCNKILRKRQRMSER